MIKFKYFMAIIAPEYEERVLGFMHGHDAHGISVMSGQGSARSEFFDMLGLEDNKRQVITGFVAEFREEELLTALYEEFLCKHGAGIAFTVKVDGYIGLKSVFSGNL